jgi:hypothetical protein
MDFSQALTYPFNDPDGIKKLLIVIVISIAMILLPVIGTIPGALLLAGWSYEITKRVKSGDPTPLPAWDDFGALMNRGLQVGIPLLVYQLPVLIFVCIATGSLMLPLLGMADEDTAGLLFGSGMGVFSCCMCIIFLYGIAASILYWGGYLRYLNDERMGTFFQFGDNLALVQQNIGDFGMAVLFIFIANMIGSLLYSTGIGAIIVPAFQTYFTAHILGQLARKLQSGGMAPVPQV